MLIASGDSAETSGGRQLLLENKEAEITEVFDTVQRVFYPAPKVAQLLNQ